MTDDLLLQDLASVGFPVTSLSELTNSRVRYDAAVPVLLDWLGRAQDPGTVEWVARALGRPWARRQVGAALVETFRTVEERTGPADSTYRWGIGDALYLIAGPALWPDLIEIARDRTYGRARQMVVLSLAKCKQPEAVHALVEIADDPTVDGHAIEALRKLKAPEAQAVFEAHRDDKRAWVRANARKGLAMIEATHP